MEGNRPKLSKASITLIIGASIFLDLIQLLVDLLHFIPFVGTAAAVVINFFIDLGALLGYYIYFKSKGISFVRARRALAFFGGFVLDFVPFVSAFAWTLDVVLVIADVKKEELLAKMPGGQTITTATTPPGRGPATRPTNIVQGNFRQNHQPHTVDLREAA